MNIADIFAGYQYSSGSCWECALDCDTRHVVDIVIDCLESTLTDLSDWSSCDHVLTPEAVELELCTFCPCAPIQENFGMNDSCLSNLHRYMLQHLSISRVASSESEFQYKNINKNVNNNNNHRP